MDKSVTSKIIALIVGVFLLITVISQIVVKTGSSYRTEIAMRYNSTDYIEFDGVYIRNEHVITSTVKGVYDYLHSDGSKLGKNCVIANVYNSVSEIDRRKSVEMLEKQVATLYDVQKLIGTDNSQVDSFNKLINEKHSKLIAAINSGDYLSASDMKYELLNLQSKRDMAKGKTVDLSAKISQLENRISSLKAGVTAGIPVYSEETGYFVSSADGYEDKLSFDSIETITAEEINKVIAAPTASVSTNSIGKMIEDYHWKVAAVIKTSETPHFPEGETVKLAVGTKAGYVKAKVEKLWRSDQENSIVILSGDELDEDIARDRVAHFRLIVDDYNGIRISASAIHFDKDNNIGVYVKSGIEASFVKIKKIFSGEGFVIVEDTTGESGYLAMYDSVIVEGKDLHDGKVLK